MERWGAGAHCPSTAGLPKLQHGPAVPAESSCHPPAPSKSVLRALSFCHCSHREQAEKNQPEIFLWSQWITHTLRALVSLAGQTVFSGFHTKGCEIAAAADCLHLFSDRKRRRAAGPMIRSVQTDTGNSKQISHRGMWIERREKPLLLFAQQILVILQNVYQPAASLPLTLWWFTVNCKVCGFNWDIWTLWDSRGER